MQPVEYDKSDLKITLDNINILKKVSFHLKYQTTYGQVIYVYGDHPLLGSNQIEKAIPLTFLDDTYWGLNLDFSDYQAFDKITYHYFILNPDGTRVYDWGNDKVFNPNRVTTSSLVLMDAWNYTGYIENVFYTEPFINVLLQPTLKQKPSNGIQKNTTHIFRVKAPLIATNQTLCIVGASKELGKWDVKNPILLTKIMESPYFEVSMDLEKAVFPFEYKYGVFDLSNNEFVCFEDGTNRVLPKSITLDKKPTC
jgi:4-alpha-glucanotransferase